MRTEQIQQAHALLNTGQYSAVVEYTRQLVEHFPENGFIWTVRGIALDRLGHWDAAVSAMRTAVRCDPADAGAPFNLANMLKNLGRLEESAAAYRVALSLKPAFAEAYTNLGYVLRELGKLGEAEDSLSRAVGIRPDLAIAQNLFGLVLRDQGRREDAMRRYQMAIDLYPGFAEAHYNLGVAYQDVADLDNAICCYRLAVTHKPGYLDAYFNLGLALKERREYEGSEEAFLAALQVDPRHLRSLNGLGATLAEAGRHEDAFACFNQALMIDANSADTYVNLGTVAIQAGRFADAEAHYRKAIELAPQVSEAHCNLGIALVAQGRLYDAEDSYRHSLALDPDRNAAFNLGCVLRDQGRLLEAEKYTRDAISRAPTHYGYHHGLLFTLNYDPDRSGEEIFEAYREFDEQFGLPLRGTWPPHVNDRNPARRLKIGYVSPDFCHHVVRHFLEPLLARHDKREVEVFAYGEVRREDDVTARFRTYADHWIPTIGLSDEALAERVRADGIDILVDLAGHTAGNRLLVFARKPAPVSVSWLGYGYTTGLSAIDYLLTDEVSCPAGCEHVFSETPWRVATPALAYRAPEGMGDVSALPASTRGFVTFGTLTRGVRINHRTIRVWSEILTRLPDARLIIDSGHFRETASQEALGARFAAHGIARERLEIGCHSPPWDVLRGMDIGLDCFPHNSGTTLFESLYLGVPFVTLAGRPSVGRLGSSILEGLGHPEWIAHSEEDYIEKVVTLASDLQNLSTIRANLRQQMLASPLMDEAGFARKVEAAYRKIFKRWATGTVP